MPLPFEVTVDDVSGLNSFEFPDLLNRLLRAETSRIGLLPTNVQTTLRVNDRDGGVDARVRDASSQSDWIPQGLSVWQFKSGADHGPADLRREFLKPRVQEALRQGGCYVVAVKEALNTDKQESREKALRECCSKAGIPSDRCRLLTAERIALWATQHTALCLLFRRAMVGSLMQWEHWASLGRFQQSFRADRQRDDIINEIRKCVTGQSALIHIRIEGLAGIGKTRLGLEALRPQHAEEGIHERALYALTTGDVPQELFSWIQATPKATLVLIVDECDRAAADRLLQQAERCQGRLRLISIGQAQEARMFDVSRPDSFLLGTLDDEAMREVLQVTAPSLPKETTSLVVEISSGFVKLATTLAQALQRRPELASARELARVDDVREVIRKFLTPDSTDYRAMQAVALLSRVGWEGELADEGQAVTEFMGLLWTEAQLRIERLFHEGIVSKQGRYRYVTPHLLAVWLASEVWDARPDETLELLGTLSKFNGARALLERLRDLGDDAQAKQVTGRLLGSQGLFGDIDALNGEARSEIFALLVEANPQAGLNALQRILEHMPRDQLLKLRAGRRHIVWALEKLAWLPGTFFGAARLLLSLAEAENETWANNATGVWIGLFGTFLGGTAVPALQRHQLIEEALQSSAVERQLLAVSAIRQIFNVHEARSTSGERQKGRVVPAEWHPRNAQEDREVRLSGLRLLDLALASEVQAVREAAKKVLLDAARELPRIGLADEVLARLRRLPLPDYEHRCEVRRAVELLLEIGGDRLDQDLRERLIQFRQVLAGDSFADRLRRWTGEHTIADRRHALQAGGYTPDQEAAKLAEEAMQSPELLRSEWEWLASDRAQYVYAFARRLGELDVNYQWWPEIEPLAHSGKGSTFASAYLQGQAGAGRREWRDRVLNAWVEEGPEMAPAVLDAVWRGGLNDTDARRLVTLLGRGWLTGAQPGLLVWGAATRELSAEAFFELIQAMLNDGSDEATASALDLLHQRVGSFEGEKDSLAPLVWTVLERRGNEREDATAHFHRSDLAGRYVSDAPLRVARAMLDLFKREGVHFSQEDSAIQVLAKATDLSPQEIWEEVAPRLLARKNDSLRLYMCLRGWYGQRVGEEVLLPWARDHQPEGPSLVAALIPVGGEPLDELPRQLLIEFGKDKAVASALHANLIAGTFFGPASAWYGAKLEAATKWLHDPHPAVRKWAQGVVDELESQLGKLTRMEAEARF